MSLDGLLGVVLPGVVVGGNATAEGAGWGGAVHAAALMGPFLVVGLEVGVEGELHLLDGLEPGPAAFDAEVLVEQRAVEALNDAVGLRPADLGLSVLDARELEEELIGWACRGGRRTRGRCR